MLLLNLWEELKGQVLRPLPLRLIHQDLDAGRLILRIGTVIQLIIYLHVKWNLTGYILHTGLPCHHFWHWRTLKAWTLARWTKYATTEFLLNCSWFRCLVTCYSHSYLRLQTDDSGLASYVAGQIDRTLSWKVIVLFSLLSLSLSLVELCGFLALITFWSLTTNRMCSGWWPSPNCPSWWRVYSQLRTVSANKKLLKIYTSLEQPVVYGLLIITVLALELQQDSLFRLELQALLYPIMELDNLIMSLQLLRLWRRYPYPFLFLYIFLKSLILDWYSSTYN